MEANYILKSLSKGVVLLLFFTTNLFAQDTWYVSTSGDDTNGTGAEANPWKSPEYAAEQVTNAGDTIKLMPGTFTLENQIVLNTGVSLIGSGKEGANKTLLTANWEESTYEGSLGYNNSKYLIQLRNVENLALANFAMDGNNKKVIGGIICQESNFIKLHDIHVSKFYFTGMWFDLCDGLEVARCSFNNSAFESTGYSAGQINIGAVSNSIFKFIDIYAYDPLSGYGIKALNKKSSVAHWKNLDFSHLNIDIKPNAAWNNYQAPNICFVAHRSILEECVLRNSYLKRNISISKNTYQGDFSIKIHNNIIDADEAYALEIHTSGLRFYNNYIPKGSAIASWDADITLKDVKIHHNTFEEPVYSSFIYIKSSTDGLKIYNNIFNTQEKIRGIVRTFNNNMAKNWEFRNNIFLLDNPTTLVELNESAPNPSNLHVTNNALGNVTIDVPTAENSNNFTEAADVNLSGDKPFPWYKPLEDGNLVDKGYDMGSQFAGSAPEIGVYEIGTILSNEENGFEERNITIYPNPVSNKITIQSSMSPLQSITLYNLNGQIMKQINEDQLKVNLDVSKIRPGIYLLESIDVEGKVHVVKLVKN